ncbi:conserved oligomeric Golgi complex subunit 6 [Dermacentor andersoni]|uniref:conserved oligomeric Golgi complex subunit 6 n=1 Tax=Dermacentor andersoni TaxID=34620 RepID=UPI002155CD66|nr:conserved oligomeric Golgi complex subunit 6-like [Dermacentor andersoni]
MAVEQIPEDVEAASSGDKSLSSNPLSRKLNKLLEARLENDRETLEALRSLSEFFTDNNIRTRRRLRGDLEKRSLAINEEFVQSFSDLKASMSALSEDITAMAEGCAGMVERLHSVKRDTRELLARTGQLRAEARRLEGRQQAAQGFLAAFQPSPEQAALLRGTGGPIGRDQLDERFLDALAQSRRMHDHCKLLLRSSRAQAGLQLMESLAAQQEAAYERLYRWLQNRCRVLGADAAAEPGLLLARAFGALRERPLLWGYALDEYANARRACVVRHLIDALTRGTGGAGGTGGSRPLESLAKDPLRYAGDMLAWAHQCAASERELLEQLLAQCGGLRGSGGGGEAALDHILAGLCSPLRLRLEQLAVGESSPLVLCRLRSVVRFYATTLGTGTALAICLDEVAALAHKMFLNSLTCHCTRLLDKAELPPGDLGAPPFLQQLLSLVRELLSTRDGSLAPVDQRQKDLPDILAQVLEPALAACEQLSSRLAPADRSVHLLNCLQLAQTGLAVLEMTEPWLDELEARQKPHIDCLVEEQLEHFVSRLGSALAEDPSRSGSIVPLPEPLSLQALSQGLAELCEQPEAWGTLPPLALLVGRQRQQTVRRAALDKLWHRYAQLHMRVYAASDRDLAERLPLAPDTLREALLLPPLTQQAVEQDGEGGQGASSST